MSRAAPMETSGSPRVRLKPTVSAPMASIARNPNLRSARENRAIASRPAKKLTKIRRGVEQHEFLVTSARCGGDDREHCYAPIRGVVTVRAAEPSWNDTGAGAVVVTTARQCLEQTRPGLERRTGRGQQQRGGELERGEHRARRGGAGKFGDLPAAGVRVRNLSASWATRARALSSSPLRSFSAAATAPPSHFRNPSFVSSSSSVGALVRFCAVVPAASRRTAIPLRPS